MNLPVAGIAAAVLATAASAQIADSAPGEVAGIPVNYTEAKTGGSTLPDPLTFADGSRVADAKAWFEKRRPELFKLVEENEYGRVPPRPPAMTFEVFDRGTPAFDGKALRKQVTLHFTPGQSGHFVDALIYLPAQATGPVPLLLNFGWAANNLAVAASDPGVKVGRRWDTQQKARVPATPTAGPTKGSCCKPAAPTNGQTRTESFSRQRRRHRSTRSSAGKASSHRSSSPPPHRCCAPSAISCTTARMACCRPTGRCIWISSTPI